jgi:tetratricopeptide (TPR) repeat protein
MNVETTMTRTGGLAAALAFCMLTASPALADGGGGTDTPTCPRGEVYDPGRMKCVKQQAGVLPDEALADYAYALAKAGRFDESLEVLDLLRNPNTPKALNFRGYATRKLGRVDEGIGFYHQAVALDPQYASVREYLGEAYVIKGDIASAQDQLHAIERICGTGCEEYQDLAKAIAERRRPDAPGRRYR